MAKRYSKLTAFLASLSLNAKEGVHFYRLVRNVVKQGATEEDAKKLDKYLKAHLAATKANVIKKALAEKKTKIIDDAVRNEQTGPVQAYFKGAATFWFRLS